MLAELRIVHDSSVSGSVWRFPTVPPLVAAREVLLEDVFEMPVVPKSDDSDRDLFSGLIRLHILHHAVKASIFGRGMLEELARHGCRISPGTLYPLLHGLAASARRARPHRAKKPGKESAHPGMLITPHPQGVR
jgi:hypothetical protein